MSPLSSRLTALDALSRTLDKRQAAESALAASPPHAELSGQDRAFALSLLKTTLRRLGQIDALLDAWMESPLPPGTRLVRHALRLGFAQALFMEIPAHASVHTTVELMREANLPRFVGLANALMQRALREGPDAVAAQDAPRLNTPAWLWQSWQDAYGEQEARVIAQAGLAPATLDLSVKNDPAAWAEKLGGEVVDGYTVRLHDGGALTQLPGYAEGEWWVQDAAAAFPVRLLAEAMGGLQGKKVVDLCAAPGGKTAQLASMDADVIAVDISNARLRILRENMERLQLPVRVAISPGELFDPGFAPDAILLDAPCSATGTLRRHPDIAWHREKEDIARLAATQLRLLEHAFSLLKPQGCLCYAVCSVQPEEGRDQIRDFLADRVHIKMYKEFLIFPGVAPLSGDGFYIAVLIKGDS